jgi:hypothetical protein
MQNQGSFRWICLCLLLPAFCGSSCPQTPVDHPITNCNSGTVSLSAVLIGGTGQAGGVAYRANGSGCREFVVRVAGFSPGSYPVSVANVPVGLVDVGPDGKGQLIYYTGGGYIPANFPAPAANDPVDVGGQAMSKLYSDCPAVYEYCPSSP